MRVNDQSNVLYMRQEVRNPNRRLGFCCASGDIHVATK